MNRERVFSKMSLEWFDKDFKMDKGLLADATSSDDSPTPGYMLNEISRKISFVWW